VILVPTHICISCVCLQKKLEKKRAAICLFLVFSFHIYIYIYMKQRKEEMKIKPEVDGKVARVARDEKGMFSK
jgi:hypothetical protein